MEEIIITLLVLLIMSLIALVKTRKACDIFENNYRQCLVALAETDPGLADYLEREGKL